MLLCIIYLLNRFSLEQHRACNTWQGVKPVQKLDIYCRGVNCPRLSPNLSTVMRERQSNYTSQVSTLDPLDRLTLLLALLLAAITGLTDSDPFTEYGAVPFHKF